MPVRADFKTLGFQEITSLFLPTLSISSTGVFNTIWQNLHNFIVTNFTFHWKWKAKFRQSCLYDHCTIPKSTHSSYCKLYFLCPFYRFKQWLFWNTPCTLHSFFLSFFCILKIVFIKMIWLTIISKDAKAKFMS